MDLACAAKSGNCLLKLWPRFESDEQRSKVQGYTYVLTYLNEAYRL